MKKKRIKKLIEFIRKNFTADEEMSDEKLKKKLRKVLGMEKQCFKCLLYYFDDEVKVVEGTDKYVCDECAEKILAGRKKVREHEL